MNLVIQQGRLVENPEKKYTVDNKAVTTFSIAVSKKFKKEGGPTADFHDCVAWGVIAENTHKFFNKGDMILIKGRLEDDNYVNNIGVKVYQKIIIVEEFEFGPKKRSDNSYGNGGYQPY